MTRIVRSRSVREGYVTVTFLTLVDDRGSEHTREVVSFGQSACVLPFDPDRRVAMTVQLARAPLLLAAVEARLIEAPAGMIDAGESAEEAARREALEEVGLALRNLEAVAVAWPSPGVLAERSHLFLATYDIGDRVGPGGGLDTEHEGIAVHEVPLDELWGLAASGGLQDMKTLTLVLALRVRRPDLFEI